MKKALQTQLLSLTDAEFKELQLSLQLAEAAKKLLKRYNVSSEEFAKKVGISPKELPRYLSGAYPYHIRHIAGFEAYHAEFMQKEATEQIAKAAEVLHIKDQD